MPMPFAVCDMRNARSGLSLIMFCTLGRAVAVNVGFKRGSRRHSHHAASGRGKRQLPGPSGNVVVYRPRVHTSDTWVQNWPLSAAVLEIYTIFIC
jgi:hypothetical protein